MSTVEKYTLFDFIKIPLKCSKPLSALAIIKKIISALLPSLTVVATANFINTALEIFGGEKARSQIYFPLILLAAIVAYQYLSDAIISFVTTKLIIKLNETFRKNIVIKKSKLRYQHIENNESYEIITRVSNEPAERIFGGFDAMLNAVGLIISISSLLLILLEQVWWAGVAILIFSIPLFKLSVKTGNRNYEVSKDIAKLERRANYLMGILTTRESANERTMFEYTETINAKWYSCYETARKMKLVIQLKNFVKMKAASSITLIITALITIVLIIALGKGGLTIGMFIALITATLNLVKIISNDLTNISMKLADNRAYLDDLNVFNDLSEEEGAIDEPQICKDGFESLEFINVTFAYPGTNRKILDNCSFRMQKNLHYAFVGVNGAGKTTITKLLTGLYSNFEGKILINGKDILTYKQAELKGMFSVIFQDFSKYYISLEDNILLGNLRGINERRMQNAIKLAGLDDVIDKLPNRIHTNLGKIKEDGVDLSGGQWQRVAIARSLVSEASITILDEPTAALDPIAESKLYEMFDRISLGKSTIFITHRMSAAKLADEIIVIVNGSVAEKGSHDFLMQQNSIYAGMYESQRSWYE